LISPRSETTFRITPAGLEVFALARESPEIRGTD